MADAAIAVRHREDSSRESPSGSENDEAPRLTINPPAAQKLRERDDGEKNDSHPPPAKKSKQESNLMTKTGGAYIPPAKLRMMQERIADKSSVAFQRLAWEALKKSINGLINKVNTSNIAIVVQELIRENIIRGRGLLARSVLKAQAASITFTHVYAALVAVLNTKFPQIGLLILRRLIHQFRRSYRRNNKTLCLSTATFIAHLVNQHVADDIVALQLLLVLLDNPTDDSVEVAVGFMKECGHRLGETSSAEVHLIFERFRSILHEAKIDKRIQYMIDVVFAVRKDKFKDHPSILPELDLVEEAEQVTHVLEIEDDGTTEEELDVFTPDAEYMQNEEKYKIIRADILGEDESGGGSSSEDEDESEDEEDEAAKETLIIDETQSNLTELRRVIYLTIMSSLDFEECAHKLLKMNFQPTQEREVCHMLLECCSQERSYLRFYGLLAQRFCQVNKSYEEHFCECFQEQYDTIHRLETNKLRNVAKLFGHLLLTDAIPWTCMVCIHLNEDETTSSSRIFIKILFQELSEFMGLPKLNERLKDPTLAAYFEGLMPRDNPRNTRFSINFFTSVGLGGLTDDLREHLKNAPKMIMTQQRQDVESSSSDDSSSDSGSSDSDSSDSSSPNERAPRRRHRGHTDQRQAAPPAPRRDDRDRRRRHSPDDRQRDDRDRDHRRHSPDERRRDDRDRDRRRHSPDERRRDDHDRGRHRRHSNSPDERQRDDCDRRRRHSNSPDERRRDDRDRSRYRRHSNSPDERRRGDHDRDRRRSSNSPDERRRGDAEERRRQSRRRDDEDQQRERQRRLDRRRYFDEDEDKDDDRSGRREERPSRRLSREPNDQDRRRRRSHEPDDDRRYRRRHRDDD
ncbi:pre-mRNA-splicing factor CWC22 homolog [Oscarella lobularis]|uniref:pre-mRNA-splicing factor CWC22 homolog n=1 Tax=Oscarella lobularis TaxID=121494 RepID=UPI0033139C44